MYFVKPRTPDAVVSSPNIEPYKGSTNTVLIIILVIAGLVIIGAGVYFYMRKRNQKLQTGLQDYEKLT